MGLVKIILLTIGVALVGLLVYKWYMACERDRYRPNEGKQDLIAYLSSGRPLIAPYNDWVRQNTSEVMSTERPFVPEQDKDAVFPQAKLLRDHWETIRDEALAAYDKGKCGKVLNEQFFRDQRKGGIADEKWKRLYIKWYTDQIDPLAQRMCPKTCALIKSIPNLHCAMFSVLEPGAVITPHRGPFCGCLRYHLGLSTPKRGKCSIIVGGEPYRWRDGEDVLFDDTFTHSVRNDSDELRIILFCDVERPMRSTGAQRINKWVCRTLGPATKRTNERIERAAKQ